VFIERMIAENNKESTQAAIEINSRRYDEN
jgi:hypothetical protein